MKPALGIDFGGTSIKLGVVLNGEVISTPDPIKTQEFEGRDQLLELVIPVQDAYAKELGASELLEAIRAK